jgi:hypothetical protein
LPSTRHLSRWRDRMFAGANHFWADLQPSHLQYANLVVKRGVWR